MKWFVTIFSRRPPQHAEFLIRVVVIGSFLASASCDGPSGPTVVPPLLPLPDNDALYMSMDGEGAGIWVANANSMELIDSLTTKPGVPWTIEFSNDWSTLYSCWGRGTDYALYSVDVSPLVTRSSIALAYAKGAVAMSAPGSYLVAYGYKGVDVFDRENLTLVLSDTTLGLYSRVAMSRNFNKFYFTLWPTNQQLVGFGVYDLDSFQVVDSIVVFDYSTHPGLQDADLVVSLDDKFLYFSAWNWRGGGGFGSFFVVDVIENRIIAEFPCGGFSQLSLSPDGRSVYISDPSGYLYGFPTTGKVLRFDVYSNTMHVLLDSFGGTDRIAVAEDNRTLFISAVGGFETPDGQRANVVKVDAATGQIIGEYAIALDSAGQLGSSIRNIRLGRKVRD